METATIVLNCAYLAYVAAGLFRTTLALRIGLVLQALCFLTWGILTDSLTTVVWNILFVSVNVVQAVRIARRNAITLSDEEEVLRVSVFGGLSRRDFLLLWSIGRSMRRPIGEVLCREDEEQRDLLLLLDGEVHITTSSGVDLRRSGTTFLGEVSFFTGRPANADVVAATPIRFRTWNQDDLHNLRTLNPTVAGALHQALGRDIGSKLNA